MASIAISARGTLLKIGDGGTGEVFTNIAEVTNITGPSLALDTIEVTSHDTSSGWREFIGGLLDAGEVSLDINFVPTNATHSQTSGLLKDFKNRTLRNFKLVFPDTGVTTWSFAGLVTAFECSEAIDDVIKGTVTLKLSGQPTLTG
jgi:predicted secreted protein